MILHSFLHETREAIRNKNNDIAHKRLKWINRNKYFYNYIARILNFIVHPGSSLLHVRCGTGYVLNSIKSDVKIGIDHSDNNIKIARESFPSCEFQVLHEETVSLDRVFDYILVSSVEDIVDINAALKSVRKHTNGSTRVIIINYNYLWQPLIFLAEFFGLKMPQKLHNWINESDLKNFLAVNGFEKLYLRKAIVFPFYIPIISTLLNRFVANLPIIRHFCFLYFTVARVKPSKESTPSVSIIIPCRNEAGNIEDAVTRIPTMGSKTEILFGDDNSSDGTGEKVLEMIRKYPDKDIKLYQGPGICKAENVWKGFEIAKNDILMILDADLTVIPEELPYFYEAIVGNHGEFINGSRLVYPMHSNAMRLFNVVGNKFFSIAFSYILDFSIKDTLCGTKVMWRHDYEKLKQLRGFWGINDRWGDYELIFGAAKLNLKIIDLPIHYYERTYGETKMKGRIKNGLIMLRMCWAALFKFKLL